ncbi:MAG TPA: DegV family protein [Limnochordia bacterium]|jgi:DegV family protein with EDD domain|nr:DegV family protein [Bacillota bacterium]HOK32485.1 DegV family protein [Limnochordia bacterium]NLO95647.1 DegV family protein [Bacillota bacterium]HAI51895.1 DegV family protein [Bacillota bacterium]HOL99707.1 DegV family protein [Limnochordia bacterium]
MGQIHVVTDSGSDLPVKLREELGIQVVPLTVRFGDEVFKDGVDLTAAEFYARLKQETRMPSTSQPSPAEFVEVYERIAKPGDTIISIHLSSKMSGTYQSAMLATTMIDPKITVHVVDSRAASLGIGVPTIAAAKAAQAGKSAEEILTEVEGILDSLRVYFVVDTLEYLQRNGRIGLASALVGTLLNIKPVLTLVDGQVAPFEKIRGRAKAFKRLRELGAEFRERNPGKQLKAAVSHADNQTEADTLAEALPEILDLQDEVVVGEIGATIGVHAGPGTVAVFLYCV